MSGLSGGSSGGAAPTDHGALTGLSDNDHPHYLRKLIAGEIAGLTEKASPVAADMVLINDSEDADSSKMAQAGNLPGGVAAFVSVPASQDAAGALGQQARGGGYEYKHNGTAWTRWSVETTFP